MKYTENINVVWQILWLVEDTCWTEMVHVKYLNSSFHMVSSSCHSVSSFMVRDKCWK